LFTTKAKYCEKLRAPNVTHNVGLGLGSVKKVQPNCSARMKRGALAVNIAKLPELLCKKVD
jgi:hypothetical protein